MASLSSVDAPFGLRPIKGSGGAPYNGAANAYYLRSDYAIALFVGDPVIKTTDGSNTAAVNVGPGAEGYDIGTLPVINKASVNTASITGVIIGFAADPTGLENTSHIASTEGVAFVADDPDLIFEIQCDAAMAAADIGLNASLIFTQGGSTVTGLSGAELDVGTTNAIANTAGLQLSIRRSRPAVDNLLTDAFPIVEVKINRHQEVGGTVGKTGI
ncbi:hypothetical protein LCGC14_0355300 [marine sediment metagenome]|uniref:Uncharacterized protein n=1 Tax=marine sediment metagenome TaxID=412755 RepID=A0A0F9T9R8_9ZZZZ